MIAAGVCSVTKYFEIRVCYDITGCERTEIILRSTTAGVYSVTRSTSKYVFRVTTPRRAPSSQDFFFRGTTATPMLLGFRVVQKNYAKYLFPSSWYTDITSAPPENKTKTSSAMTFMILVGARAGKYASYDRVSFVQTRFFGLTQE